MTDLASNIEGLPFYNQVVDLWNDYAGEHFNTKDPYVEELPDGKSRKRKLPEYCSKDDQKVFKKVQKRAWIHDRCFMGCYPVDCGVGAAPIVSLLPVIGPLLMYAVHARLIHYADQQYHLGAKTVAKLEANILFDLIITITPIIGSLLSFLNACSTRNAAIIYNTVSKREYAHYQERQAAAAARETGNPVQKPHAARTANGLEAKVGKFFSKFDTAANGPSPQSKRQNQYAFDSR